MSILCLFSSERVCNQVRYILGARQRRTSARLNPYGYVVKKWSLSEGQKQLWVACVRNELTLEEPARRLARIHKRGPILLFPFAAGAAVMVPPDVPNAHGVCSIEMLERHLRMQLTHQQRQQLCALLFDGYSQPPRHLIVDRAERREALRADQFVEAMRLGEHVQVFGTQLFELGSSSGSSESSPPRTAILGALRDAEPAGPSGPACSVCPDNRASICFIPCAHQVACDDCVRALCAAAIADGNSSQELRCPICRCALEGAIRPFV